MTERKFRVRVEIEVEFSLDEAKFTPDFMEDFRRLFYPFDTIEDHAKHIARRVALGLWSHRFNEGYGPNEDMGIKVDTFDGGRVTDIEILEATDV